MLPSWNEVGVCWTSGESGGEAGEEAEDGGGRRGDEPCQEVLPVFASAGRATSDLRAETELIHYWSSPRLSWSIRAWTYWTRLTASSTTRRMLRTRPWSRWPRPPSPPSSSSSSSPRGCPASSPCARRTSWPCWSRHPVSPWWSGLPGSTTLPPGALSTQTKTPLITLPMTKLGSGMINCFSSATRLQNSAWMIQNLPCWQLLQFSVIERPLWKQKR